MRNPIDQLINGITMYRLVIYELSALLVGGALLSFWKLVPFSAIALIYSTLVIFVTCWVVNEIFARIYKAPSNPESVIITALILACIIAPVAPTDFVGLPFVLVASCFAMACKYVISVRKRHIFNPAAFGVAIAAFVTGGAASWWVGNLWLLPISLIGGILIVRKLQRFDLMASFALVATVTMIVTAAVATAPQIMMWKMLGHTPIVFFATVMLTEPLTTPPGRRARIVYGALTGLLFAPAAHIGDFYFSPELALLAGNVFSWIAYPKGRRVLRFKERVDIGPNVSDLLFEPDRPMSFRPGQYVEWTVPHAHADSRGARRYFTIASSPSEPLVRMGVRFMPLNLSSSFKKALRELKPGDLVAVSPPVGEFMVPKDPAQKLVLIAGGIGVTPYRSIVQDFIDRGEKRDVVVLYANKIAEDIAYAEVFKRAEPLGVRTVYTLDALDRIPPDWKGRRGMIDAAMITEEIPDFRERMFYISGPHGMVNAFQHTLRVMGVPAKHIKVDFFPGFA